MTAASGDPFEKMWAEVEAAWTDDRAHKRLVIWATSAGRLGELGKRYRTISATDPERKAEAEARLEAVFAAAMVKIAEEMPHTPEKPKRPGVVIVALLVSFTLLIGALWAMMRLL